MKYITGRLYGAGKYGNKITVMEFLKNGNRNPKFNYYLSIMSKHPNLRVKEVKT